MTPKSVRVSLLQLFSHEIFAEARRRVPHEISSIEANKNLSAAISQQTKQGVSGSILFLIGALLTNGLAEEQLAVLRTPLGNLEFPAIYIIFLGCIGFFLAICSLLTISTLLVAQAKLQQAGWFFNGRPAAYLLLGGSEHYDFLSPIRPGNFFIFPNRYIIAIIFFLPTLLTLTPVISALAVYFRFLWRAILNPDPIFLGVAFELCSISLVLFSSLFVLMYFIPSRIKKDTSFIRWAFLIKVTRVGPLHHNSRRWLAEEN